MEQKKIDENKLENYQEVLYLLGIRKKSKCNMWVYGVSSFLSICCVIFFSLHVPITLIPQFILFSPFIYSPLLWLFVKNVTTYDRSVWAFDYLNNRHQIQYNEELILNKEYILEKIKEYNLISKNDSFKKNIGSVEKIQLRDTIQKQNIEEMKSLKRFLEGTTKVESEKPKKFLKK